ncbi:MAG: ThuA domain-containing protein, partial [Pseudomonadota bacterium]
MKNLALIITCLIGVVGKVWGDTHSVVNVLMTVGGVGYNTSIVRELRTRTGINLVVRDIDDNAFLYGDSLEQFDAILMYHRDNVASDQERDALETFLDNGGGVVVLHHAIANYLDWEEWWKDHVGGL